MDFHVLCQPGGSSERAAILKHLDGKAGNENVHECIAALRKWRRYLERAEAMQVSVPDPSLLLNALEIMVRKVLAAHPEVKFRVDLIKNSYKDVPHWRESCSSTRTSWQSCSL